MPEYFVNYTTFMLILAFDETFQVSTIIFEPSINK